MDPVAISILTAVASLAMTIIIATIAYFLKRYITQSDAQKEEMHTTLQDSYKQLTETTQQLTLAIETIKTESKGAKELYQFRLDQVWQDIKRNRGSIKELWAEIKEIQKEIKEHNHGE